MYGFRTSKSSDSSTESREQICLWDVFSKKRVCLNDRSRTINRFRIVPGEH